VGAEQFGWVHMPRGLSKRVRHLAELDGSLCAVVHDFHRLQGGNDVIEILTWSGGAASSWSTRCCIELSSLPQLISEELKQEKQAIMPLCTTADGKILLATGHHKVFAYDALRNSVQKVFSMYDYVEFPVCHSEARLLINIYLHEERIVGVPKPAGAGSVRKRLHVKLRGDTVGRREKHRSEIYGSFGTDYSWVEMTQWTPKLKK
jgi:hypothetical protein